MDTRVCYFSERLVTLMTRGQISPTSGTMDSLCDTSDINHQTGGRRSGKAKRFGFMRREWRDPGSIDTRWVRTVSGCILIFEFSIQRLQILHYPGWSWPAGENLPWRGQSHARLYKRHGEALGREDSRVLAFDD